MPAKRHVSGSMDKYRRPVKRAKMQRKETLAIQREADENGEDGFEACDQRMTHKQVGNVSVTFNEGASVLLVSPHVSWSLGEREELLPFRQNFASEASDPLAEMVGTWAKLQKFTRDNRIHSRTSGRDILGR